jgi:general secretion pathway protein A
MYNAFYGLDVDPFRVNPDPRFLYFSESHREALATLVYAVRERKGFIVLTGEVGTGKTTVLNALLQKLDRSVQTAYLFNTALSLEDFFAYLFEELGLEPVVPFRKSPALHRLNHFLIERLRAGHQTLLIIDEAQNLPTDLLEEIRMLSNLETPQSKLLQIVLVGQPELAERLQRPELRQLRQRVELRHTIRALTPQETAEYVRERLLIAGHESGDLFSPAALRAVARYTRGIPRVTNVLCDNALLIGFARDARQISPQMVEEAALDLGLASAARAEPAPADGQPAPAHAAPAARESWLRRLWPFRRAAVASL